MRDLGARATLCALALLTTTCGGSEATSGAAIDAEPAGLGRWTVTEDLRIRGEGTGPGSLRGASVIEVGTDGRLYVARWQDGEIVVFDRDGAYLRTLSGGMAVGPIEIRSGVFNLGWLADTLYVAELTGPRILYFSADGDLLGWSAVEGKLAPGTLYPTGRAAPLGLAVGMTALGGDSLRQPVLEVSRDGRTVDTLGWIAQPYPLVTGTVDGREWSVAAPQLYRDHDLRFQTADGRTYYELSRPAPRSSAPADFEVQKLDRSGRVLWERSYRYNPVPVRASLVDSAVAATVRSAPAGVPRENLEPRLRQATYVPPYQPPVRQMRVNPDESFWLLREDEGREERWELFGRDGIPAALVSLPAGVSPALFRGEYVYSWDAKPGQVPELVRYRIVR